jgi:hypothetical protein
MAAAAYDTISGGFSGKKRLLLKVPDVMPIPSDALIER